MFNPDGTENVGGLSLVFGGSVIWNQDRFGSPCAWPADAFANMKELKLLELGDDCVEGDLGKLPLGLVWLRWRNYPYECMPPNLRINHAIVLDFCGGKLVSLWDDQSQIPLKLRELNLQKCYKLQRVPDSIGRLRGLQKLDFSHCLLLKTLSEEVYYLKSLEVLNLNFCLNLEYLPSGFGGMRRLRHVSLRECKKLKALPESFGLLPQIEYLDMYNCKNVRIEEGSFGSISTLKEVYLLNCLKLETFPTQLTRQRSVKKLGIATVDEDSARIAASAIPYPTAWLDSYHFQMMSKRDTIPFVSGSSGLKCSLPAATTKECTAIIICFISVLQLNDNQLAAPPLAQCRFQWCSGENEWDHDTSLSKLGDTIHLKILYAKNCYQYIYQQSGLRVKSGLNISMDELSSSVKGYFKYGWFKIIRKGEENLIQKICGDFFRELRRQRPLAVARASTPSLLDLGNEEKMELVLRKKQLFWRDDKELEHLDLSIMNTTSIPLFLTLKSMVNLYNMDVIISARSVEAYKDELQEYQDNSEITSHANIPLQVAKILKSRDESILKSNKRGK
eukprot:Gb_04282 [translate_table: standard]